MQKHQDSKLAAGLVGVILLVAVFIFMRNKAIGESCGMGWECKGGPCLTVNEDSFCTIASKDCPIGSRSMAIEVRVKTRKRIEDTKESYCIPARLVKSVKSGATGRIYSD